MPDWLTSLANGTPEWLQPTEDDMVVRTQGDLKELEEWVPSAGLAMLKVFFPRSLDYANETVRDNVYKRF